jgi:hypothetical protein
MYILICFIDGEIMLVYPKCTINFGAEYIVSFALLKNVIYIFDSDFRIRFGMMNLINT